MDRVLETVDAAGRAVLGALGHGLTGNPHNDSILILTVFACAAVFWHAVLWTRMPRHRRMWRGIDYVWYGGAFLSLVLGTYQVEREAAAAELRETGRIIQTELQRQNLVMLALVIECDRLRSAEAAGHGADSLLFDPGVCRAARPILREARLFAFEHMSSTDRLFFIRSKMVRLTELCTKVEAARAAAAGERDSTTPEEKLYSVVYCDDAQGLARRTEEYLQGRKAEAEAKLNPLGGIAHLWPVLLCFAVGLRVTKTTAEMVQAGR